MLQIGVIKSIGSAGAGMWNLAEVFHLCFGYGMRVRGALVALALLGIPWVAIVARLIGWSQLRQRDRPEAARIHADVKLARHRLELAMAVAMQVDGATMLPVPASERIMAEHQRLPFGLQLCIVAHA